MQNPFQTIFVFSLDPICWWSFRRLTCIVSFQSSQHGGSTPSSYTFPEYVNSSLNYITLIVTILGVGRELTQLTRDDRHFGDGWSHAVTQEGPALWLKQRWCLWAYFKERRGLVWWVGQWVSGRFWVGEVPGLLGAPEATLPVTHVTTG